MKTAGAEPHRLQELYHASVNSRHFPDFRAQHALMLARAIRGFFVFVSLLSLGHAATPGFDDASDRFTGGSGAGSFNGKDGGTPVTFGARR